MEDLSWLPGGEEPVGSGVSRPSRQPSQPTASDMASSLLRSPTTCFTPLGAAGNQSSKAAVERLVQLSIDALRPT